MAPTGLSGSPSRICWVTSPWSRRSAERTTEHAVCGWWRPTRLARMSAISRDDVAHLAMLARIDLSDAELDNMSGELAIILQSVARVSEVATDEVPPTSHPLPLTNVTRPDVVRPSLSAEEALAAAPASEQQRFSVPRILDEADPTGRPPLPRP